MPEQRCADANLVPIRIISFHLLNDKIQVRNVLHSLNTVFAIHVWGTVKNKMVFTVKSTLWTVSTGLILSSSFANAAAMSAQMARTINHASKVHTGVYNGPVSDPWCWPIQGTNGAYFSSNKSHFTFSIWKVINFVIVDLDITHWELMAAW